MNKHRVATWLTLFFGGIALAWWLLDSTIDRPERYEQVTAEATSPDGTLVARLWCRHRCEVPEARTLTVSPADRSIDRGLLDQLFLDGREEARKMPVEDVLLRFWSGISARPQLRWDGPRSLRITSTCLRDDDGRTLRTATRDGVVVQFESGTSRWPCPEISPTMKAAS
jgi:hypothetical protein